MRALGYRLGPLLAALAVGAVVVFAAEPALRAWLLGDDFRLAVLHDVTSYEWWLRGIAGAATVAVGAVLSWYGWRREGLEASFAHERALLRTLVDSIPDQIYAKDRVGRFVLANPCTVASLGAGSEPEVLGRTDADFMVPHLAGLYASEERPVLERGEGFVAAPREFPRPGGGSECFLCTKVPLRDGAGRVTGLVGINHEVTAMRAAAEAARANAEWLRAVLENVAVGVIVTDRDDRIRMTNARLAEMLHHTPEDLVGRSVYEVLHPDDRAGLFAPRVDGAAGAPLGHRAELRCLAGTGACVWVEASSTVARDGAGNEVGRVIVLLDVGARKAAEEALRKERDFGREVLETIGSLVVVLDADGRIVVFNRACEECTAYASEEVVGRRTWEFLLGPEEAQGARRVFEALRLGAPASRYENHWVTRQGDRRLIAWSNSVVRDADGEVEYVLSTGIDVTEHRRAEEERQRLFSLSLDMLCVAGTDGMLKQVNPAWTRALGWTAEELTARPWIQIVHPDDREATLTAARQLLSGRPVAGFETRFRCVDGSYRHLSWNAFPLLEEELVFAVIRDVTDLRRTERVVKSLVTGGSAQVGERFFESMVLQLVSALGADLAFIGELGPDETIHTISICAGGEVIDNVTYPLAGSPSREVVTGGPLVCRAGVSQRFPGDLTMRGLGFEGYVGVPLHNSQGEALGLLAAVYRDPLADTDLAAAVLSTFAARTAAELERRRAEDQQRRFERKVQQGQRLESLGVLAGGVAHDFNNVLGAVMGYTELSLAQATPGTQLAANLHHVFRAATRARDLVRQILTFTRQVTADRQVVAVTPIVAEALRFLRSSLPATVVMRSQLAPDCGPVRADGTQLHQVIVNLCTNAQYAMRDAGGILEVRLEQTEVDATVSAGLGGIAPGTYVRLSVSDTGCGMDEATRERIFEPFFTTKAPGEGSGLGLAVTHGIVASHGGAISVYSEPGRGTTFRVYLPRCAETPDQEIAPAAPIEGGTERILVVDDEPSLAELDEQMLSALGYRVTAYTSGPEALAAFLGAPDEFDLVATDQTMPGITGLEITRRIHETRPDIPVLLLTGFSHAVNEEAVAEAGADLVLMKPYTVGQLATAVRQALTACARAH
jgi:PAS domain S-box-containing protein